MYRIAVIDDNETWCFVMSTVLQERGFFVSTFNDAYAFLPKAKHFDLVLVDFSLPPRRYQKEKSGSDLIRQLKATMVNPPIMVLISAYFTEDILPNIATFCPQADAYLSKSLPLEKIIQQLARLLSTKGTSKERDVAENFIRHQVQSVKHQTQVSA